MEHAQRVGCGIISNQTPYTEVLILILMEHAQRAHYKDFGEEWMETCLNPYFNGTCSKRARRYTKWRQVWLS